MFFRQIYKGGLEIWQFLLTIIFVILGYFVGQFPLVMVMGYYHSQMNEPKPSLESIAQSLDFGLVGMSANLVFFLLLLMFILAMVALYVGVTMLHKRPFQSIWTGRTRIDWKRVLFGFGVWMLMTMAIEAISFGLEPENYVFQFDATSFLILLLIGLFILPIQTTFEELFVRGYLLQTCGYLFSHRWVGVLITSLIFASLHMMNPEVQAFGAATMMIYYVIIALFLAIITLLDDGLELAIGIHAATNFYGAVFVNFDDSAISTDSLFKLQEVDPQGTTIFSVLACIVFLLIMAWKYGKLDWRRVFGLSHQDFDDQQISELHSTKNLALQSDLDFGDVVEDVNMDGLEEGLSILQVDKKGSLLMTERAAPFVKNGLVQHPFQLGYYELIMASSNIDDKNEEESLPDYQTQLGRDMRIIKAIARESHHRKFLSQKPYKLSLEDGQVIYFILQPFPNLEVFDVEGWKFSRQLVSEISSKQYDLAKSNGGRILIQELRNTEDFPFISDSQGVL